MATKFTNQGLASLLARKPPQNYSVTPIDFEALGFPEYKDHFAVLIENLFTTEECQALLKGAESSASQGWEQAMVNVGNGQQMVDTETRLCDRILWDDHAVAASVLARVMPHLPPQIATLTDAPIVTGRGPQKRKETWRISRLNERLRFLKYTRGMYFRTHCDGSYATPNNEEISFMTVHLYLNGADSGDPSAVDDNEKPLAGGATRFLGGNWERAFDVDPKAGSVLVFQHRNLMHSGEDVEQGTKYTLRSDIMYRKVVE